MATYHGPQHIGCPTPYNRAVGRYTISVSNDGVHFVEGKENGNQDTILTVLPLMTMTSIWPTFGHIAGGYTVIVEGSGFDESYSMQCVFDGMYFKSAHVVDQQHLECTLPAHAVGAMEIGLGYEYQKVVDIHNIHLQPIVFTYVPEMRIESVVPASGSLGGGTNITVTASGLMAQTDGIWEVAFDCMFRTSNVRSRLQRDVVFEDVVHVKAVLVPDGSGVTCQV